ncbi:ATP-binding protein [Sphaerisporangium sp. NPDC049002]|uniref:AlbA family DNA-binding domain-containing protein n=1 Tax=Sphaerisporangium sp. NPDC049002 TaxID=3155392 RepID=UPI0033F7C013
MGGLAKSKTLVVDGYTINGTSHLDIELEFDDIGYCPARISTLASQTISRAQEFYRTHPQNDWTETSDTPIDSVRFNDDGGKAPWDEATGVYVDFYSESKIVALFILSTLPGMMHRNLRSIVTPVLMRYGLRLVEVESMSEDFTKDEEVRDGSRHWEIHALVESPAITIVDIYRARREMSYAAFFTDEAIAVPEVAFQLASSGNVADLLGRDESQTLEVKRSAYDLQNKPEAQWKIELAQDVASFANAEVGGLIVIGIETKQVGDVENLKKIHPLPSDPGRAKRYRDVVNGRVHPPIDRLRIESVEISGGEVLCILIPTQKEEDKPFIVEGGLIKGKTKGRAFHIVRRRGSDTMWIGGRELHAMILAGRALLRYGRISDQ